jgi:hypothetical protein
MIFVETVTITAFGNGMSDWQNARAVLRHDFGEAKTGYDQIAKLAVDLANGIDISRTVLVREIVLAPRSGTFRSGSLWLPM